MNICSKVTILLSSTTPPPRRGSRHHWLLTSPSHSSSTSADCWSGMAETGATTTVCVCVCVRGGSNFQGSVQQPESETNLRLFCLCVQLQAFSSFESVCHPPRSHHICHAGIFYDVTTYIEPLCEINELHHTSQAVFSAVFYFAAVALYEGILMVG